jgi:hypothetical protein
MHCLTLNYHSEQKSSKTAQNTTENKNIVTKENSMKVIATVSEYVKLCELTVREIALLRGMEHSAQLSSTIAPIGLELDIEKGIAVLETVRNFDANRLQTILANLNSAIKVVEKAKDTVEGLNVYDMLVNKD